MDFHFRSILKILSVSLRHNFIPHLAIALVIAFLTQVLFGISSLDAREAAQLIERLLSLVGTVLLTPIFLPEQNENIRDLIRSKRTDYLAVCLVRLVYSVFFLAVIIGVFAFIMQYQESEITIRHVVGGFASALFLGALGFSFAGISQNTVAGYMVSMIYFILNFVLRDELGNFYLFSMSMGSFAEKYWLLGGAVALIAGTLGLLECVRR